MKPVRRTWSTWAPKDATHRIAVAEGTITMQDSTLALIMEGGHKKGDVLGIARVAGIMAAKKTAELIPLCHPMIISHIDIGLEPRPRRGRGVLPGGRSRPSVRPGLKWRH